VSTTIGLIGEYAAASAILSMGWRVSMAQQDAIDLLAFKDDAFLRIQVKTAHALLSKGRRNPSCHFQLGHGGNKRLPTIKDYDIVALVKPDTRLCIFYPIQAISQYTKRVNPTRFTAENEAESWQKAVDVIMEMRRLNGLVKVS